MRKIKKLLSVALIPATFLFCSCKTEMKPEPVTDPRNDRGNAVILDGKTAVVSIFANDYASEWDFSSETDIETRDKILSDLKIALDYITTESRKWGKNAEFIYDWGENPDLYAERNIPAEAVSLSFDGQYYLEKNLTVTFDFDEILAKYNADNVVFLYHFNTAPDDYDGELDAAAFYNYEPMYEAEFCVCPRHIYGKPITPSIYAHEILHLFGAPDYYGLKDMKQTVTEEYIEFCAENHTNEIMFKSRCEDEPITSEIAEITAYYVGWTDYSEEAERFGLFRSQHLPPEQS